MFSPCKSDSDPKKDVVEAARLAREERALEKRKDVASLRIQAYWRSYLSRRNLKKSIRDEFDEFFGFSSVGVEYAPPFKAGLQAFSVIKRFLVIFQEKSERGRFEIMSKFIIHSFEAPKLSCRYISVVLMKSHTVKWIVITKKILWQCCTYLKTLKPEIQSESKSILTCLLMVMMFSSPATWKISSAKSDPTTTESVREGLVQVCNNLMQHLVKNGLMDIFKHLLIHGLCRSQPVLSGPLLSAISTISLRLMASEENPKMFLFTYASHILAIPGFIYHLNNSAPEAITKLSNENIFPDVMFNILGGSGANPNYLFRQLEANMSLSLLANMIQLGQLEEKTLSVRSLEFMSVVSRVLHGCKQFVESKRSTRNTHWHPIMGWFSQSTDSHLSEAMPVVIRQLSLLWGVRMMRILFRELLSYTMSYNEEQSKQPVTKKTGIMKLIYKSKQSKPSIQLDGALSLHTCTGCSMFKMALATLTQLRMNILAGLSYQELFLPNLWCFIRQLGPNCGTAMMLEVLTAGDVALSHQIFDMLTLFCDTASHLIVILDDQELYIDQKPFTIPDLIELSSFINKFLFTMIWNDIIDVKEMPDHPMIMSMMTLLNILYERNCRKEYVPPTHWLVKEVKSNFVLSEISKGRYQALYLLNNMPHIIPFKDRVVLFRRYINEERTSLGVHSTFITIHRSRLIEDGYAQLSQLPINKLKGLIRVKFVNEQGLDEAGIDQDGVFKEFLEETISRIFDPHLNLFKVTDDQKLYPSHISYIQENHLNLFEFVGKMLAKAVYEGIVVDVPFASFFLTKILGQTSAVYSFIDELPSLDSELYRSLSFIKHYSEDVSDLDLTFSYDEEIFGRLITHELVPGGKVIIVNNDNKIHYIHVMAQFKMHTQIKEQTNAFIRGFRSVIRPEWTRIFSAPELQKLISGDTIDIDFPDLRKHTQYYGGYHNNHKVIRWLWDILINDFSIAEQKLFLKFVTSCSKPPLLGFDQLEPPFSIRYVEVSEDQDTGDTVGSVLKGFLNLKKRGPVGRLPTSSTCFNLLKLPNYSKRSILRDKLRYAIASNTGFELS